MNLTITPPQQIIDEITAIDSFLNIVMSEDMEEAVVRGNDLASHIARSDRKSVV